LNLNLRRYTKALEGKLDEERRSGARAAAAAAAEQERGAAAAGAFTRPLLTSS